LRYDETDADRCRRPRPPTPRSPPRSLRHRKDIADQVEPLRPQDRLDRHRRDQRRAADRPQPALTVAGFNIQQDQSVILEEPTEITRTLDVPMAEFRSDLLALLEESAASNIAAAVKLGTGKKVPFGNIFSLSQFRLALGVRKSKKQGIVTEGSGGSPVTRGAFVWWVAYNASLTGGTLQSTIARGNLASQPVQFKLAPDPTISTEGAEYGFWATEDAPQTVALT
jgi:hypothetical protein